MITLLTRALRYVIPLQRRFTIKYNSSQQNRLGFKFTRHIHEFNSPLTISLRGTYIIQRLLFISYYLLPVLQ